MKKYLRYIRSNRLFDGFADSDILAVLPCMDAHISVYVKHAPVFLSGDEAKLGLVLEGSLSISQVDAEGDVNLINKVGRSDVFGATFLFSGAASNVDVHADARSTLLLINHERLLSPCRSTCILHKRLIRNVIRTLSLKLMEMREKLAVVHKNTIRSKLLAYFGLRTAETHANNFEVPFTRNELADYLGVNRSALSRELSNMQKAGLIEYSGNSFVYRKQS